MEIKKAVSRIQRVPVVAFEEGLRLGKVNDVYIDKKTKRVQGISFKNSLWAKEKAYYVDISDVLKIGIDVIIIARLAAARPLTDETPDNSLKKLIGLTITTKEGEFIGELTDLNVNREDGKISEFILTENRMLEVDIDDVVIGPDVIVVPAGYTDRIGQLQAEKTGLLTRMFVPAGISDSFRDKYEEMKASFKQGKGSEKMFDALRSGSERTHRTVVRASQKIRETIEQMRKRHGNESGTVEEEVGNQGTEAEYAGKTYFEPDSTPAHRSGSQGPIQDFSSDADLDKEAEESQ